MPISVPVVPFVLIIKRTPDEGTLISETLDWESYKKKGHIKSFDGFYLDISPLIYKRNRL